MKKRIFVIMMIFALCLGACAEEDNGLFAIDGIGAYEDMYRSMQEGEAVENGTRGDTAKALQELLIALGWDIDADGIAGAKTIAALNEAQEAYGLEVTGSADAAVVLSLVECLAVRLYGSDAEAAVKDPFAGFYTADLIRGGKRYEAYAWCAENGLDELAASCALIPEAGGTVIFADGFEGNEVFFTVRTEDVTAERITVAALYGEADEPLAQIALQGADEAEVRLPAGEYTLRITAAEMWFGDRADDAAKTYRMNDAVKLDGGCAYTLTVNADEPGAFGMLYTLETR